MSKINKTQKYAILWLHSQGSDENLIAKELDVTAAQIANVLKQAKKGAESNNSIKTKTEPVGRSKSKDMMITESSSKTRNVAIMTKEASQLNDELKKNITTPSKVQRGIFRPNG